MNSAPQHNPNGPTPFGAYIAGTRDAVDAVRPAEPTEAQWDAVRRGLHARLLRAPAPARPVGRWRATALAVGGAAVAAAVAWVAFAPVAAPDRAAVAPVSAPGATSEPNDPLAEFGVLPMARAEDVDIQRVPGAGFLPAGADPLPDVLTLATTQDIELDGTGAMWPAVTPSPGDAPMIFAAKPR